jgi:hypothetical protein
MWKVFLLTFGISLTIVSAQLDMSSDKMKFEDNIAEESSHSDEAVFATKPILNDGKPFFVARDPSTGNLDFNQKKTAGIVNDIPKDTKDELTGFSSKNGHDIGSLGKDFFHDKLNLPVKYSSSKFVYPLISGSYANLKYQGNNKQDSNHKNYTSTIGTTPPPKYYTHIRDHTFTATFKHPTTSFKTTTTTETPRRSSEILRTTTTTRTTPKITTKTTTRSPVTTEAPKPTTIKYSSTIIQQNQFPSTFKNYVDSSETRKKTTSKIVETTTTRTPTAAQATRPANPVKFVDEEDDLKFTRPTTYRPPLSQETRLSFSTSMPILKPSAFKPVPTDASLTHSQKIKFEDSSKNPSVMSLSEIFNAIAGGNDQNSISYDTAESNINDQSIEIKTLPPTTTTQKIQPQTTTQNSIKPQFVDLPVFKPQPSSSSSSSHVNFPTNDNAFQDYVEFENPEDSKYANQYVKYEVQKPSTNLVAFKQIPSMNNVVISPSQNSASFVLGSQQSVGSVGVGSSMGVGTSEFVSSNNGPMKVGQVINEEPPIRGNTMQANVRFPIEGQGSYDNAQIVKGTIKLQGPSADVVQPPQALSQNKPTSPKPLVFPSNVIPQQSHLQQHQQQQQQQQQNNNLNVAPLDPSKVIFENANDIYEKVNDKIKKQEIMSYEVAGNIAPGELKPPNAQQPPNSQYSFNRQTQPPQPPKFNFRRPGNNNNNGQRPPLPPMTYQQLPNILPQFRPNQKSSHGHPPIFKEMGSIRVPSNQYMRHPYPAPKVGLPSMMSPPPPQSTIMMVSSSPSSSPNYRRGPPPTRKVINRITGPYPPQEANRRIYRPQQASSQILNDLTYMKPPPITPPNFHLKRILTGNPETLQMIQRPVNVPNIPAVNDSELNKSLPPAPSTMVTAYEEEGNGTSLEPVVTLQMLQSKKSSGAGKLNLPPVNHEIVQDLHSQPIPSNHKEEPAKKPSVYVVYPVQSQASFEDSQSSSSDDEKDEVKEPSIIPEYQNTPFSVVSHFEQEPLLMKKDKKKPPNFPYYLEKPTQQIEMKSDRPSEHHYYDASIYNIGEQPNNGKHPDAISSKLMRATERPIAIAYTPTEPSRVYTPTSYYRPHNQYSHYYDPYLSGEKHFSNPNFGRPVIPETHDEKRITFEQYHRQQINNNRKQTQQEPITLQKEHYDFQAPFLASVSLNPEVTNPYEGWAVVTQSSADTNKIDRADHINIDDNELTTKKFDLDQFHPQMESGFMPIYSERRVSTAPEIEPESDELFDESNESTERLQAAKLVETSSPASTERISTHQTTTTSSLLSSIETSSETSKSTTTSSSEESTTVKIEKKQQKKKIEIDSLEAFFESLTRDYDEDESLNKSENESRSL